MDKKDYIKLAQEHGIEVVVMEAQKEQQIWDLYQTIDILEDQEYTDKIKIYRIRTKIKELLNKKNEQN